MRGHGFYLYDVGDMFINPSAFHTMGIGQMDVLYVRPSSEKLPSWLRENHVNMCGSNRASFAAIKPFLQINSSVRVEREEKADLFRVHLQFINAFSLLFVGFILGILFDKEINRRKKDLKSKRDRG